MKTTTQPQTERKMITRKDSRWMYQDSGTGELVPLFAGRKISLNVPVDTPLDERGVRSRFPAGTRFRVLDASGDRQLVVNTQYHPMPLRLDGSKVRQHGQVTN